MEITPEFLAALGFEWRDRTNNYARTFHFGTITIGKTNIVWFGGYRIGRYKTQEGLKMLIDGFSMAADK